MTNGQQALLLDTTDSAIIKAYETYCEQRLAKLQAQFKCLQIQYVQVTAQADLPKVIRQSFPRRTCV